MPTTIKVFGNVKDVSRFAKRCTITIKLINGPINEDPNLIVPTELVRQTDETGYFEAPLGLGNYGLFIGSDQILFSVTDIGSGDKNIVSLLNEDLSYTRDPYNSNWNGLRQGNIQFLPIDLPSVPTNSILDSGGAITGLDGDIYEYLITFVTAIGETLPASVQSDLTGYTVGDGHFVRITFDPTDSLSNVVKIRIYRSASGALDGAFVILAEIDPTVPYYEDKQTYADTSGYAVVDVPQSNTTAGGIYSGTQLVAQFTSETGLDASFRLRIPDEPVAFGGLAFDRELCIREDVYGPFNYGYLVIRKGGNNWTIGNIFAGGIGALGQVPPPPATGYTGFRVLQEDGSWVTPSGGGGSQTPWASDIDAAGFGLTNVVAVVTTGGTSFIDDQLLSASNASYFDLSPTLIMGIHNGEPAGYGADIHLVSENGNVFIPSSLLLTDSSAGTDTARIEVNNAFTLQGVASAAACFFAQNMYFDGSSDVAIDPDNIASRFLILNLDGFVDSPNGGMFNWQKANGSDLPTWTSLMQLTPDGVLRIGSNSDDGTSSLLQSAGDISAAGSYWSGGTQGASGTATAVNTLTIVGGIVTNIA